MDNFQGEPKIFVDKNGAFTKYKGGQPIMDAGLENTVLISLGTKPGWVGNTLFDDPTVHIGSDHQDETEKPITISSLNSIRQEAERSLAWMISEGMASDVEADVYNPNGQIINETIKVFPPGKDVQALRFEKNGINWINQITSPAHKKV